MLKKKVWIKKCEEIFDKHKFKIVETGKPILSYILNNNETKLLFDSYSMPSKPPVNLPGYYMKKYFQTISTKDSMKKIFAEYKKLSENEKAALNIELQIEKESYKERYAEFIKNLPPQREADLEHLKSKEKKSKDKTESFENKNTDIIAESENETHNDNSVVKAPVFDEEDFSFINELDARIENAKSSTKLEEFLAENCSYSENSFSCFVIDDLKSQKKMNDEESLAYLKKITQKWLKLNEETKEEYEAIHKKQKKELKKNIKKFLKENENLNFEVDDMKNKKKELVRTIHIKQDEETQFDLVIGDKTQAALISSSISEIEIKGKKPKSVESGSKAQKRKNDEESKSPRKK